MLNCGKSSCCWLRGCELGYVTEQSCYRNPSGRTGLLGRGSLHRYGPNHSVMLILSRYGDEKLRFLVAKNSKYDELPSLFPMVMICEMV